MNAFRLPLLAVISLVLLNGCAAAVVGGAAAGTAYVVQDERTASEIANDIVVTSSVKTKLLKDPDVAGLDINVDTYRGEVTLYGSVPSDQVKQRAILLSTSVKGVKKIISRLVIVPPGS
jgi:hyperosmotically inducible protein